MSDTTLQQFALDDILADYETHSEAGMPLKDLQAAIKKRIYDALLVLLPAEYHNPDFVPDYNEPQDLYANGWNCLRGQAHRNIAHFCGQPGLAVDITNACAQDVLNNAMTEEPPNAQP